MDYPHSTPRYVHHRYGEMLLVETPDECALALDEGWTLQPPVWPPEPRPVDVIDAPIAVDAPIADVAPKRKRR